MRKSRASLGGVAVTFAILAAAACSSSDSGTNNGQSQAVVPVTQAEYPSRLADAVCSSVGRCCTDWGFAFSSGGCVAGVTAQAQKLVDAGAGAAGVTWDAQSAGQCVELYKKAAAACAPPDAQIAELRAACDRVWTGGRQQGEACANDFECAGYADGAARCVAVAGGGDAGVQSACGAAEPAHAALGAACRASCRVESGGYDCVSIGGDANAGLCFGADGLYCDEATLKCAALAAQGQPCSSMINCVDSAWCNQGTCAERIAVGGGCSAAGTSDPCQLGAWCNVGSSACEASKQDGASCTAFKECASLRCNAGACLPRNTIASAQLCSGS